MPEDLSSELIQKLQAEKIIWFASVRPENRPHMVPLWFVWQDDRFYISIGPNSTKAHNISANPNVVVSLEDGANPVICECTARPLPSPAPAAVADAFFQKYEWNLSTEEHFNQLVELIPDRWVNW